MLEVMEMMIWKWCQLEVLEGNEKWEDFGPEWDLNIRKQV